MSGGGAPRGVGQPVGEGASGEVEAGAVDPAQDGVPEVNWVHEAGSPAAALGRDSRGQGAAGAPPGPAGPQRSAPAPLVHAPVVPAQTLPAPPGSTGQAPPRDYADRVPFPEVLSLRPVAVMRSPFRERHGTPRQGVVDDQPLPPTEGEVVLLDDIPVEALADLAGFARVWLLSWMHLNNPAWSPTVRPPRGGQRRGVFATRSPHRPNPIALSCVELIGVEGRRLRVRGHDLIDGTPILDIKPYLPFADAFPGAAAGWVDALPRGPDGRPLGPRLKRA